MFEVLSIIRFGLFSNLSLLCFPHLVKRGDDHTDTEEVLKYFKIVWLILNNTYIFKEVKCENRYMYMRPLSRSGLEIAKKGQDTFMFKYLYESFWHSF
jgi:hypothetical protein